MKLNGRAFSYLTDEQISKIHKAYVNFKMLMGSRPGNSKRRSSNGGIWLFFVCASQDNGKVNGELNFEFFTQSLAEKSDVLRKDMTEMSSTLSSELK